MSGKNWDVQGQIIELASREQGVTRQELLVAHLGCSVSGLDATLRRLVSEEALSFREEARSRDVGMGASHARRMVRVYRVVVE